ncbi:tyrosine-type recombinase/integrase [Bradyrhizobium lupini]|uniref:tyrosine-type recombinase/integrase n=1 Tax=Rhizobium lupini TaxID=136996 RepID=UPI0034C5C526
MPQGRISKKSVDALRCSEKQDRVFLWDDALSGFGVAAFPSQKKIYYAQYRQHGRSRRIALGEHGRLTPDQARSEAKKLLGAVETGSDPIAERREQRARRTLAEAAADFMVHHVRSKRKPRTAIEYQCLLDRRILPALGSRRLVEITRSDVARLHSCMASAPFAANRCLALLSSIWNWAARRAEVPFEENPARGIEKNPERSRERFLTRDEFGRLGESLRLAETVGVAWETNDVQSKHLPREENRRTTLDPFAVAAIRLLIFTGARLGEILSAKWDQVDVDRRILFLPDSKTGKKPIYLPETALAILDSLPRLDGNPYIIAGSDGRRADLKRPWSVLRRAADLKGVRLHDLRHSFASYGAEAGLGLPIIGKLLGHTQPSTTNRYAHLDASPLRRASEDISTRISGALNPHAQEEKAIQ